MIQILDDIFDKIFLLDISLWLMHECNWTASNVANHHSYPYKIEGSHRLMGSTIYDNPTGTEEKYWEHVYKIDDSKKLKLQTIC